MFTSDGDDGTNIQAANSFMTAGHSCVMIVIIIVFIRVTVWMRELLPKNDSNHTVYKCNQISLSMFYLLPIMSVIRGLKLV